MIRITNIPKKKKTKSKVIEETGPKLTEYDYIEISEKIGESLEFQSEVSITTFQQKRYETYVGVVKGADTQTGMLTLHTDSEGNMKIKIDAIASVN